MNQGYLKRLRDKYPVGTRVMLVRMNDVQAPPVGTTGTVNHVDDMGTIHVNWENGSSLGLIPDSGDLFNVIPS